MMALIVNPRGQALCLYTEAIDLRSLGMIRVARASHLEPDDQGRWWADLSPVAGPILGPFGLRSEALAAERHWLNEHLASLATVPRPLLHIVKPS